MTNERRTEFTVMLLLERRCLENSDFYDYIKEHYNIKAFNSRYMELLDDFLNNYALNKTEKSEENL